MQLEIGNEQFTAIGLVITDRGFLNVYPYDNWNTKQLPEYHDGEQLTDYRAEIAAGHTTAPVLLNEADLIALMDKHGIGTDATHAEHIDKIQQRVYVALNDERRFLPGFLALALVDGYDEMGFEMSKPGMRASLEAGLKCICEGSKTRQQVLEEQIASYERIFEETERNIGKLSDAFRRHLMQRGEEANGGGGGGQNGDRAPPAAPAQRAIAPIQAMIPPTRGVPRAGRARASARGARGARVGPTHTAAGTFDNLTRVETGIAGGEPSCPCGTPAVRRQVKKEGPNKGRWFFTCAKTPGDPAKCNFFGWAE